MKGIYRFLRAWLWVFELTPEQADRLKKMKHPCC